MIHRFAARLSTLCIVLTGLAPAFASLPSTINGSALPSLSVMLERIMPSVVNIMVESDKPNPHVHLKPDQSQENNSENQGLEPNRLPEPHYFVGLGSGVIVDAKNGYIVTNDHLVVNAKAITVNLSDGRKFKAKLIGGDQLSDLAILQIHADKLSQIKFANSDDAKVGDFVAAIGNPFGLKQTVTSGIISALQRSDLALEGPSHYENFIQTDASINPGNSGGALVNLNGELLGINTAILAPSGGNIGIGFAIPSNMVNSVMAQLIQHGGIQRGMVGIMVQNINEELARAFKIESINGAVVTQITPRSPAATVDIRAGDLVTRVDGKIIKSAAMVRNIIGLVRTGSTVNIELLRGNTKKTVNITTEDPKKLEKILHKQNRFLYGLGLENFSHIEPIQGQIDGILINHVMENSPAWHARLLPGDVIVSASLHPVKSIDELLQIEHDESGPYLLLNIRRAGGAIFVPIKGFSLK